VTAWLALRLLRRVLFAIDCVSFVLGLADVASGRHAAVGAVGIAGAVVAAVVTVALVRPGPRPSARRGRRRR
jgi:hypothetical protein